MLTDMTETWYISKIWDLKKQEGVFLVNSCDGGKSRIDANTKVDVYIKMGWSGVAAAGQQSRFLFGDNVH